MSFGDHTPETTRPCNGGVQHLFKFANGYGASVVRHPYSYGGDSGLWGLAVLDSAGSLTYKTPITNDVLGRLTEDEVAETLDQIVALTAEATS